MELVPPFLDSWRGGVDEESRQTVCVTLVGVAGEVEVFEDLDPEAEEVGVVAFAGAGEVDVGCVRCGRS
jgi:hypothetical protein